MKHCVAAIAIGWLMLGGAGTARAESAQEFALVEMQKLVAESIAGKAARSNLEHEMKKRQAALAAKRVEVDKFREEMAKQSGVLSPAAREEKSAVLQKKMRDFDAEVQSQREELDRRRSSEMAKVVSQIDEAVKEFAAQGKCRFILEKDERAVIYADGKLDITAAVLALMDKKKVGM